MEKDVTSVSAMEIQRQRRRAKMESWAIRSRENIQKAQDIKLLDQISRDESTSLKHLRQQELLVERKMRRLEAEKSLIRSHLEPKHVAMVCRNGSDSPSNLRSRGGSSEAIREIKLKNVGSIFFENGGFLVKDNELDKTTSSQIISELNRMQEQGRATGARQVTVTARGNANEKEEGLMKASARTSKGTVDDEEIISLESLHRGSEIAVAASNSLESLRIKRRASSLPILRHASSHDTGLTGYHAGKFKISARVLAAGKKWKKQTDKLSQVFDLLTQGPGFSPRDARVIVEFMSSHGDNVGYSDEVETMTNLKRIINLWKGKAKKLRRSSKDISYTQSDDSPYWENDADWRFILKLVNRLRSQRSSTLLTPIQILQCRYLRLSDSSVIFLEKMCRNMGVEPGIHPYSKPSSFDPNQTNLFQDKTLATFSTGTIHAPHDKSEKPSTETILEEEPTPKTELPKIGILARTQSMNKNYTSLVDIYALHPKSHTCIPEDKVQQ